MMNAVYTIFLWIVILMQGGALGEEVQMLGKIWTSPGEVPSSGPTSDGLEPLDSLFREGLFTHQLPGAAVAVAYKGNIFYSRGFGYADLDAKSPLQPDSLLRIASVSKPITSAAVLQLVAKGAIELDQPAFRILPIEPLDVSKRDPRIDRITIRQLLHHTAGFDRKVSWDPMFQPQTMAKVLEKPLPISTRDVIRFQLSEPLDFDPGERFAYSNYGYCVLGRIIEEVSGESYGDYLQKHIFRHVGIKRMKLARSAKSQQAKGEVSYYVRKQTYSPSVVGPEPGRFVKAQYGGFAVEQMDAHGGWIASAEDLVRFGSAFEPTDQCPYFGPGYVKSTFGSPPDDQSKPNEKGVTRYYALGWSIVKFRDGRINAYHGGSLPGTSTILVRRHDGFCWAMLFNCRKTSNFKAASSVFDSPMHQAVNAVARNAAFIRGKSSR